MFSFFPVEARNFSTRLSILAFDVELLFVDKAQSRDEQGHVPSAASITPGAHAALRRERFLVPAPVSRIESITF